MKKIWAYSTSTPIQRVGVIFIIIGLFSLLSWVIKEDLSFGDIFNTYYMPDKRDSFFYKLYYIFIPLGLLMSWGYSLILKVKRWVLTGSSSEKINSENSETTPQAINKTSPNLRNQKNIHFQNNLEAFKYASQNYIANMNPKKLNIGIIQDVLTDPKTGVHFLVQLADKGKTTLVSGYNDKYVDHITKGNLVFWGFVDKHEVHNPLRIEAVGHVIATIYPELNPNNGKWTIKKDFTK
jgi:hypothetical protein